MAQSDTRERERFEKWAESEGYIVLVGKSGGYWRQDTKDCWHAWQAATAETREECARVADFESDFEVVDEYQVGYKAGCQAVAERIRQGAK